jgi:ribosomal protein S18 acetylase RimI-like enzyme
VVVSSYDADAARDQSDVVRALYGEVYAAAPYSEGPDDVQAFATNDWPRRLTQPAFRLVLAHVGGEPAGFTFGHALKPDTRWWAGALDPLPPDLTAEPEGRTFAVIELGVREQFRHRGIARALHTALLRDRPEQRVTLLVRPEAEPARELYDALGYSYVCTHQPYADGPTYRCLLMPLPVPADDQDG